MDYGAPRTVSDSTLYRMSGRIKADLSRTLGGQLDTWNVTVLSCNEVSISRKVAFQAEPDVPVGDVLPELAVPSRRLTPHEQMQLTAIDDECVELCRQRYVTAASRRVMRDGMPRTVPWELVQLRWEQLARGPPIVCSRTDDNKAVLARQLPSEKLRYMLECLQSGGRLVSVGWPLQQELWIRLGVDGVRMWKSNIVTVSLGPCSVITDLPLHSMYRFGLVAVQRSQETVASLTFLLQTSGIAADVTSLDGSTLQVVDGDGVTRTVRVRVFVCGDHMALYKIMGARGPGSEKDGMEMCPYCSCWPRALGDLSVAGLPVRTEPRADALLPLPPLQCPPDAMHGAVNVLHNSIFPCMRQFLLEAGWGKGQYVQYMNVTLHLDVDFVSTLEMPKVEKLARSIDSASSFLRDRKWVALATTLRACLTDRPPGVAGVVNRSTVGQLFTECFRALTTQMDVAYTPSPTPEERDAFRAASADLRRSMLLLDCKATPWVHVWLCHLHQFLDAWGTLYPWLGHGVEGRHRRLKQEVRTSTCGQWKGNQVGFAHCLRRDNVWWSLVGRLPRPGFSGVRADRRRIPLYAAYKLRLRQCLDARTGSALLTPSQGLYDSLLAAAACP
jgi:hypothetical protein